MIIKKAEYLISETDYSKLSLKNYLEFLFVGRSNVGKSSLINALTNRKNLAYTSGKPGKTITLNFYNINDLYLFVDVPGYGYARRELGNRLDYGKMIENYLHTSKNMQCCFLIVDSRHVPTEDDVLMYNYLIHLGKKVVVVATKTDKISKNALFKSKKDILSTFKGLNEADLFCVSSLSKIGIDILQNYIESYCRDN